MAEEGHELGLHSNRHDYMQHMTKEEALDDLSECQSILTEVTGVTAKLFRPPGGLYSQDLLDASRELLGLASCSGRSTRTIGTKRRPRRCCRICSRMRRQGISS